jgi:uncharacterized protein (DUF427 family)
LEDDAQVSAQPRTHELRIDKLRSGQSVRIELDGVVLAESSSAVLLYETGLPTRYYFERAAVRFEHLIPSTTETSCPFKGRTSGYWSAHIGDAMYPDLAWCYETTTPEMAAIAGRIAFYNERVDITLDGVPLDRPVTHFS